MRRRIVWRHAGARIRVMLLMEYQQKLEGKHHFPTCLGYLSSVPGSTVQDLSLESFCFGPEEVLWL